MGTCSAPWTTATRAKAEDTYLVHAGGLERVTTGPGWPADQGSQAIPSRPLVLEVH